MRAVFGLVALLAVLLVVLLNVKHSLSLTQAASPAAGASSAPLAAQQQVNAVQQELNKAMATAAAARASQAE